MNTQTNTKWILATLSLSMLMPALETSIANSGLPTLARVFDASFGATQWIVLAYLLLITTFIVSIGRLGDVVGPRRLLLIGITLFTSASLFCGLAPTLSFLIAARAIQGLGAAMMMALTLAFVGTTIPAAKTGRAMGILGTMSAIGTTLGPSLGGILIAAFNWRSIFLINIPLGILNVLLARRYLPADPEVKSRAVFDGKGTLLLAVTLAAYALAMTVGHGHFGILNLMLLATSAIGTRFFFVVESKALAPLIQPGLLRNPALNSGLIMSVLVSTVMMATLVVGPFYLTRALRIDTAWVGLVLSIGPCVAAITGIPAGRIVDRLGTRSMTSWGLIGIASGVTLLAIIPLQAGVIGYVLPLATMTASYALFQTANNTAIMNSSGEQRGLISGLLNLSRNLGLMTGASLMGSVFAWGTAATAVTDAEPEAIAQGLRATFALAAVLMLMGLGILRSTSPTKRGLELESGQKL